MSGVLDSEERKENAGFSLREREFSLELGE
jgi:hypothetical protein